MVRSKVVLKCIEDVQKRRVSFSKRRAGLMKKAGELSVLCNADIGVIVFSSTGKLYEYASSSIRQLIRRYLTATESSPAPSQAQLDPSHLLAEQAEEINNLKQEVMMLESENTALLKELERHERIRQSVCYKNTHLETALTLRPPSNSVPRMMVNQMKM